MSENPEFDYFMNEEKSDVIFVVEGQHIPAIKTYLSVKSRVFSAMFSGNFKETKDEEIVIEDTTYEAFKTLIEFLYFDDLFLKDDNDFELIEELYKLSDRYDVSRMKNRITDKLCKKIDILLDSYQYIKEVWLNFQPILKIAFDYKIEKLMNKVMEFIYYKLEFLSTLDNEELFQLNDLTDGRFFTLLADNCRKYREYDDEFNDKIKELFKLMANKFRKASEELNELKESLKKVKQYKCDECEAYNQVQFIDTFSKCQECDQLFYDFK